ncbi:hypothetical protein CC1G_10770 [Coprinopsis cinerea okayama7|uniref:Uncharacterized protein n=1 Tax=Coprinopsis cinerea (strain Okayama-7 / 130 / ATCC MYA-4618 / FGSC 9003) TaxID=240176 RepID=A8P3D6_COPC7|nr:hypothetical protein CC1G_10770 [Coprinopsis cinerea okayama7\|eukprot:XP_001838528.1 hypothetical protein CC1G_10770 [Coprinopsis cinerea okayama7\
MSKRPRREGNTSSIVTSTHGQIRVTVRTEVDVNVPGGYDGEEKEVMERILDVIVVDHERLRLDTDRALDAMVDLSDKWNRLEDKLEEIHGDKYEESLVNYPQEVNLAMEELREALKTVREKVGANGDWIRLSQARLIRTNKEESVVSVED